MRANVAFLSRDAVRDLSQQLAPHLHAYSKEAARAHQLQLMHGIPPIDQLVAWKYDPKALLRTRPQVVIDECRRCLRFLRSHRREAYFDEDGRFRWSSTEFDAVQALHQSGVSISEIAEASGRSERAVRIKLELAEPTDDLAGMASARGAPGPTHR